ncbi:MAG: zinc-ribbon domain-containing protein [Promethearchaeota archaeon]
MAWIAAAAAACAEDGRRRKKPGKLVVLITILSLVMGLFVPLALILGMYSDSSMTIFLLIFIFMIGIIVIVAVGFTETLDQNEGTQDDSSHRNSNLISHHIRQRPRRTPYCKNETRNDYYWGSEPKSSSFFCMNCGTELEPDDRFCASCGWRVN